MKDIVLKNKFLLIYSMLESFWLIYGYLLSNDLSIKNFDIKCILLFIVGLIIIFILNISIRKLFDKKWNNNINYKFSWKKVFLYFFLIMVLWLPILLAYYPGIWAYDVFDQLPHIAPKYSRFNYISAKHPITHTLFLELFIIIGKKIKSYELGILLCTIVQMIIVSLSLSYSIEKIKSYITNKKINRIFTILSILFYGLMPFSSVMAISSTKDILFSSFFIISLIHLFDLLYNKQNNKKKIIFFGIFSLLSSLFKNNFFIFFIIEFIVLIIYFRKDILKQKYLLKLGLITIILFYTINFSYNIILKPGKTDIWEGMPVQVNTLCHLVKEHPKVVEQNMKDGILFDAVDIDFIPVIYCFDSNADAMKDFFADNTMNEFNKFKFMVTWFKLGLKYPVEYFDSFSYLNIGSWYLFDETYVNVYEGKGLANGYLSTMYIENLTDTRPDSKFKWLHDKMELILTDNVFLDNIVFKLILSPCLYIIITLYFFFLNLDRKEKNILIIYIPIIFIYFGILFGPCILVRYVYPFMMFVPLLIGIHFGKEKKENLN